MTVAWVIVETLQASSKKLILFINRSYLKVNDEIFRGATTVPKNLTETLVVTLLDKEYQVTCPAEEKNELIQSSHDLDRRMRGIRASGNVMGIERIAVMAALNLCHEVLQLNRQLQTQLQQNKELEKMTDKVEQSLAMLKHVSCETEDQALTKFSQ